jgi:hypothetical protein
MPDQSDITSIRITSTPEHSARIARYIEELPGYCVIQRQETPLNRRTGPGLRMNLTLLHGYPPVSKIHAWLTANGWQMSGEGPAGAMWVKIADVGRAGVPLDDSDEDFTRAALDRIAAAEGMTTGTLVAAIHLAPAEAGNG